MFCTIIQKTLYHYNETSHFVDKESIGNDSKRRQIRDVWEDVTHTRFLPLLDKNASCEHSIIQKSREYQNNPQKIQALSQTVNQILEQTWFINLEIMENIEKGNALLQNGENNRDIWNEWSSSIKSHNIDIDEQLDIIHHLLMDFESERSSTK